MLLDTSGHWYEANYELLCETDLIHTHFRACANDRSVLGIASIQVIAHLFRSAYLKSLELSTVLNLLENEARYIFFFFWQVFGVI